MKEIEKKFEEKLEQEYQRIEAEIDEPNILLVGGTGVGKSSLVNLVFNEQVAEVGTGKPVTDSLNVYQNNKVPVVLYDTQGYEVGTKKQEKFLEEVVKFAVDNQKSVDQKIHLVWYCINASGHRVTDIDKKTLRRFYEANIPTTVVFTKCDLVTKDELGIMKATIKNSLPNISIFNLTTIDLPQLQYLDLEKLIDWSINRLPAGLKVGFIKAQKRNLKAKKEEAKRIIVQHTSGSSLVGFSPIPFSDAPILVANQAGMFARILNVYDLKYMLNDFKYVLKGLGIGKIISASGIWLVAQLSKFIPVAGQIAGGLISASVASTITAALGFSISEICYRLCKAAIENKDQKVKEIINNLQPIMGELFENYYKQEVENKEVKGG